MAKGQQRSNKEKKKPKKAPPPKAPVVSGRSPAAPNWPEKK